MISYVLEATRTQRVKESRLVLVMLVSYVQGAKGNKGVSYYNATL